MDVLIPEGLLKSRGFTSDQKILLSILRSDCDRWWSLQDLIEITRWKQGKITSIFSKLDLGWFYEKEKQVSWDGKLHTKTVYKYVKHKFFGDEL